MQRREAEKAQQASRGSHTKQTSFSTFRKCRMNSCYLKFIILSWLDIVGRGKDARGPLSGYSQRARAH